MSSASIVAMDLKILGMALARDFEAGSSTPYILQKILISPKVGRKRFALKSFRKFNDRRLFL